MNAGLSWFDQLKRRNVTDWAKHLFGVGAGILAGGLLFAEGDNQTAFVSLGGAELVLALILYGWTRFQRRTGSRTESPPSA